MINRYAFFAMLLSTIVVLSTTSQSYATESSSIKASPEIMNNPALMNMLEKIELSKKILAEMQEKQRVQEQRQQEIQQARKASQETLTADLETMKKDYEQSTPVNAFARFVSDKPTSVQDIFWSMFNYQQEKIKAAKDARDRILASGGSWSKASETYNSISATKRTDLIALNKDYNIKYSDSNTDVQNTFDINGKLPRYD
ncbi:MAG TPA: hypothetical protein VFM64_04125 [Candidatus Nitrosotenuis sp.]|nr:hypothetical protein [Candidatus Nitrosotenuis sp.]